MDNVGGVKKEEREKSTGQHHQRTESEIDLNITKIIKSQKMRNHWNLIIERKILRKNYRYEVNSNESIITSTGIFAGKIETTVISLVDEGASQTGFNFSPLKFFFASTFKNVP